MKTIETVDEQKVWAVDTQLGCKGCMFESSDKKDCERCTPMERPDNRNVIFQLYEEEQEEKNIHSIAD